jgi:PAS domain S-box-containing protein
MMVGVGLWSLDNALGLGAGTLALSWRLFQLQFLFLTLIPLLWLIFALQYSGHSDWLRPSRLAWLALVPAITVLLTLTNEQHHLLVARISLDQSTTPPTFIWEHGSLNRIVVGYQYALLAAGVFVLWRKLQRSSSLYRDQIVAILIATAAPWLASVPYQIMVVPREIPLMAIGFLITGAALVWGLYRRRLLDVVPVARTLLIETMQDAVLVVNRQGRLVDLNPAARELMGAAGNDLVGRQIGEIEAAAATAIFPHLEAIEGETAVNDQQLTIPRDDLLRYFTLQILPLFNRGDTGRRQFIGRLLILHDVTALQQARREAEAAAQAKSQFVSNVSHELRTPLTNMKLYLDLLQMGREEKRPVYMRILRHETARLQRLIEDLLQVSRLDVGKIQPELEMIDLNDLVQNLCEERQALFVDQDLHFTWETQALPPVPADPQLLEQVLTNLLTNALNYTPGGGSVVVATRPLSHSSPPGVEVCVRDTGLGISPEEQEQIFERFVRGDASQVTKAAGTGLGLAISQEIARLHQGRITVKSRLGEGSVFTLWLPVGGPGRLFPPPDVGVVDDELAH